MFIMSHMVCIPIPKSLANSDAKSLQYIKGWIIGCKYFQKPQSTPSITSSHLCHDQWNEPPQPLQQYLLYTFQTPTLPTCV